MKKKRGLRRYFRNLGSCFFVESLDFSGGNQSWFDLYHIHVDGTGFGNKSWRSRKQHLDALFRIAGRVEAKLANLPVEFQYWIQVSECDSSEDAVYIHTANPNGTEFPISIGFDSTKPRTTRLVEYLAQQEYQIYTKTLLCDNGKEELFFFLTKNRLGLELKSSEYK